MSFWWFHIGFEIWVHIGPSRLYPVEEKDAPAGSQGAKDGADSEKSTEVATKAAGGNQVGKQTTTWEE